MSTQVQFRGGTAAQHATFVGAPREITVDTTNNTLRVHDGVTPGGHPLTLQALFDAHLADKANPHGVTAKQIGALGNNLIPASDANNISETGFYTLGLDSVNMPFVDWWNVYHMEVSATGATQIAHNRFEGGDELYFRSKTQGAWNRWIKVIDDSDIKKGSGSPEGAVVAPVGTLYQRTDGGSGTTLYVKESGTGNTGWKAVQTA